MMFLERSEHTACMGNSLAETSWMCLVCTELPDLTLLSHSLWAKNNHGQPRAAGRSALRTMDCVQHPTDINAAATGA